MIFYLFSFVIMIPVGPIRALGFQDGSNVGSAVVGESVGSFVGEAEVYFDGIRR